MYNYPELKIGTKGPEVGNWQRFLNEQYCLDWELNQLKEDEDFGLKTSFSTKLWQSKNGLFDTGIIKNDDRILAIEQGFIPFIQAKNYTLLYPSKSKHNDLIVIHTMENDEKPTAAENVALWFANKTKYNAPRASAHYNIDPNFIIQSVRDCDIAWHAPGANHNGIGIEHAGRAKQTKNDWFDEASKSILNLSAKLSAKLVKRYNIPILKLSPDEVQNKIRGFCGHNDVTIAFSKGKGHWDPGIEFPWDYYLDLIKVYS